MTLAALDDEIPDGLPPSALFVLRVMVDADSSMSLEALKDHTLLAESTLFYALDQLEAEGLIERRPDEVNPGKRRYSLSDALQYLEY